MGEGMRWGRVRWARSQTTRRGLEVTAVELGAGLAEIARRNVAPYPAVEVLNVAFEEWAAPADTFDAVVAATSFHWLDPAVRLGKIKHALRPGGALAVISTHHVAGGDTGRRGDGDQLAGGVSTARDLLQHHRDGRVPD